MCGHHFKHVVDKPGMIANPLVVSWTGKMNFSLSPFAPEIFGRVRPSRPASACFSILRLNLMLTHGIPLDFRCGIHLTMPPTVIGSVTRLLGHALPTDGVHRPESVGTGPVFLK